MADSGPERQLLRRKVKFESVRKVGHKPQIATHGLKFARDLVTAGLVEDAATVLGQVASHFRTLDRIDHVPAPARLRRWVQVQITEGELRRYFNEALAEAGKSAGDLEFYHRPHDLIEHVERLPGRSIDESLNLEFPDDAGGQVASVGPLPGNGGTKPPI